MLSNNITVSSAIVLESLWETAYTMFVAELFEQSENAIFDIILADITNNYSIWRRNMVALCKIRT